MQGTESDCCGLLWTVVDYCGWLRGDLCSLRELSIHSGIVAHVAWCHVSFVGAFLIPKLIPPELIAPLGTTK